MKSKKGIIILSTVVLACAVGFIVSPLVDWPVDKSNASGNIAKSSRFSRKTAAESLTNMEELLANDEEFKNNISAIYVVMQTRALQFASLVDMSNEVAGNIPAYADVLKDMNAAREMVNNVNAQVAAAGADLNAALAGESRPDLTQNTINASLAYSTLQKQNKLATRFIDTTDKYLETSEASDQLKLVRDQWVNYQQVTAALEGDEKAAEELAKKGNLLTGEQTMVAFGEFGLNEQAVMGVGAELSHELNIENSVAEFLTVNNVPTVGHQHFGLNQQEVGLNQQEIGLNLQEVGLNQQEVGLNQQEVGLNQQEVGLNLQEVGLNLQEVGLSLQEVGLNELFQLGHVVDGLSFGEFTIQNQEVGLNAVYHLGESITQIGLGQRPKLGVH